MRDARTRRLAFVPAGCALICRCAGMVPHGAMLVVVAVSGLGCLFGRQGSLQVAGVFRRCAGIVSHRATSGMQVPTRMSATPTQGRVVDVASSCAQMLACVQGCGSPLRRRVAAIISRCADIVPRWAMLVVASHHVGISEPRRVQGLSGHSFAL